MVRRLQRSPVRVVSSTRSVPDRNSATSADRSSLRARRSSDPTALTLFRNPRDSSQSRASAVSARRSIDGLLHQPPARRSPPACRLCPDSGGSTGGSRVRVEVPSSETSRRRCARRRPASTHALYVAVAALVHASRSRPGRFGTDAERTACAPRGSFSFAGSRFRTSPGGRAASDPPPGRTRRTQARNSSAGPRRASSRAGRRLAGPYAPRGRPA